jgi:hypothetical protein
MSTLEVILGSNLAVFIGLTVALFGLAAFLMGQALAATWRPLWTCFVYSALLAAGDRFLVYALFDGPLRSLPGYLTNWAVLAAIAVLAYRLTRVNKMVTQYPWLYERAGLLGWRDKS